jgi:hypothetical protein
MTESPTKQTPLTKSLESVLPFFNRKGVIVERLCGGFRVLGKKCLTIEQVDDVIEESKINLQKSIK